MKKIILTTAFLIAVLLTSGISHAGEPVKNGTITFKFDNGKTYTAKTNSEGKFSYCCVDDDCDRFTVELSSKLMPALMKAKEKANRTKCGNNLRMTGNKPSSDPTFTLCNKTGDCDDTSDRCLVYVTFDNNNIQGMAVSEKGLPGKGSTKKENEAAANKQ